MLKTAQHHYLGVRINEQHTLLRLKLSYSDKNFKYNVYRALTLDNMGTFLGKIEKIVRLWDTRDLKAWINYNYFCWDI